MKDIDFDELDRAVSSVLGQDNDTTLQQAPVVDDKKTASADAVATTSARETKPEPPKQRRHVPPHVATGRKGRFMDMVHPDAVMQPSRPLPSRMAKTVVAPRQSVQIDPDPVTAVEPVAELDETHTKIGAEPVLAESTAPVITQADTSPLIMDNPDTTPIDAEVDTDDDTPVVQAQPSTLENTVPQSSPFLDTKVEKRPLGGGTNTESDEQDSDPTDAVENIVLPRELQPDVVEAEADKTTTSSVLQDEQLPFSAGLKNAPEPSDDGRVEGHPLFDTSTYHEPIKPAKTKAGVPGWAKWTIGLVVCMGVGAGVGYLLFTAGF